MNWRAIQSIYVYEMSRTFRTIIQSLIAPVISTSLYFVVFGTAIGSRIDEVEGVSYGAFIVPGLIMLTVLMQSISNASFGIYFPKFIGTIYELLSAPISFLEIVIGYVGAAATKSVMIGLVIFASGWWIVYLALSANAYAVCVVRFQEERGHKVAEGGLYRHVRHPMYAGVVLVMVGLCTWLGSTAALIATLVPVAILMVRIVFEERMLRARLAGYGEYTARVRWRLVPGVW